MEIRLYDQVCWGPSKLAIIVDEALTKLNLNEEFEMVGDLAQMVEEGVDQVPALKVNGKVMVEGILPEVEEVMNILKEQYSEK